MPLDQTDRDSIRLIFQEETKETREMVRSHQQTIHGSDGESGLRKLVCIDHQKDINELKVFSATLKDAQPDIESLKTFRTQLKTAIAVLFPSLQIALMVGYDWVKSKFH